MAKRRKIIEVDGPAEQQEVLRPTFTNSAGETFNLFPLNPLEEDLLREQVRKEWLAEGRAIPEPPALELTLVTGEKQRVVINNEKDADTPELQAAWQQYVQDVDLLNARFSERFLTSIFLCVDANPLEYPAWLSRMRLQRIAIPDDEGERLLAFCKSWVVRSKEDITRLVIAASRSVVAVSEEAAKAAEGLFQRKVEAAAAAAERAATTAGERRLVV